MNVKRFGLMAVIAALVATMIATAGMGATAAQSDSEDTANEAPHSLTAAIEDGQVILTWQGGTDPNYVGLLIKRREAGVSPVSWEAAFTEPGGGNILLPDSWLPTGDTYIFQIAALEIQNDELVETTTSNDVEVTVPASAKNDETAEAAVEPVITSESKSTPSGLVVASTADGQVTLAWTPGTNPNYVKQVVKRRLAEATPITWRDFEVGVSDHEYTDTTAEPGNYYIYRVEALKANNRGAVTNPVMVVIPGAPDTRRASNLQTEVIFLYDNVGGEQCIDVDVLFTWDQPSHPRYTAQNLHRREAGVRPISWRSHSDLPLTIDTWLNRFVAFETPYIYRVESIRDDGKTKTSEQALATTPDIPKGASVCHDHALPRPRD